MFVFVLSFANIAKLIFIVRMTTVDHHSVVVLAFSFTQKFLKLIFFVKIIYGIFSLYC